GRARRPAEQGRPRHGRGGQLPQGPRRPGLGLGTREAQQMTIAPVRPQGVDENMLARFTAGHWAGPSGRIILADGHDARAITAAGVLNEIGLEVILVGGREGINALALTEGVTLTDA